MRRATWFTWQRWAEAARASPPADKRPQTLPFNGTAHGAALDRSKTDVLSVASE